MTDKTIYAALVAAQAEMEPARKQAENPHLRSKYADLASVMAACMSALHNHGFAVIQPTVQDENGGQFVETVLLHTSGEKLSCRVPLIIGKNDMQGLGSAMTYARRYGLMTMAGIAPEDDDGEGAKGNGQAGPPQRRNQPKPEPEPASDKPSAETIARAKEALSIAVDLDDLKAKWAMLPRQVQTAPGVASAKDARKTQLAASTNEMLADDIPY